MVSNEALGKPGKCYNGNNLNNLFVASLILCSKNHFSKHIVSNGKGRYHSKMNSYHRILSGLLLISSVSCFPKSVRRVQRESQDPFAVDPNVNPFAPESDPFEENGDDLIDQDPFLEDGVELVSKESEDPFGSEGPNPFDPPADPFASNEDPNADPFAPSRIIFHEDPFAASDQEENPFASNEDLNPLPPSSTISSTSSSTTTTTVSSTTTLSTTTTTKIAIKTLECGTHLPIDKTEQEEIHEAQVCISF